MIEGGDRLETLFVSGNAVLKRRENTLFLSTGGVSKPFPVEKVRHIVLMSESSMNSKLLCLCGRHGVRISVFDYYGYFKGAFEPMDQSPSGRVKLEQARHILDEEERMVIAREIVRGAGHNMRANLLYYRYRGVTGLDTAIASMAKLLEDIETRRTFPLSWERRAIYTKSITRPGSRSIPLSISGIGSGVRRTIPSIASSRS